MYISFNRRHFQGKPLHFELFGPTKFPLPGRTSSKSYRNALFRRHGFSGFNWRVFLLVDGRARESGNHLKRQSAAAYHSRIYSKQLWDLSSMIHFTVSGFLRWMHIWLPYPNKSSSKFFHTPETHVNNERRQKHPQQPTPTTTIIFIWPSPAEGRQLYLIWCFPILVLFRICICMLNLWVVDVARFCMTAPADKTRGKKPNCESSEWKIDTEIACCCHSNYLCTVARNP